MGPRLDQPRHPKLCFEPSTLALRIWSIWPAIGSVSFDFGRKTDGMAGSGQKAWQVSLAQLLAPSESLLSASWVGLDQPHHLKLLLDVRAQLNPRTWRVAWLGRGTQAARRQARRSEQTFQIRFWLLRPGQASFSQGITDRICEDAFDFRKR